MWASLGKWEGKREREHKKPTENKWEIREFRFIFGVKNFVSPWSAQDRLQKQSKNEEKKTQTHSKTNNCRPKAAKLE